MNSELVTDGVTFNEKCYVLLRRVPFGKVTTYKALANALGTSAYRAVGNAMNKNEDAFFDKGGTPCHRVINANGDVGGFLQDVQVKIDLLEFEGVKVENGKIDLVEYEWKF